MDATQVWANLRNSDSISSGESLPGVCYAVMRALQRICTARDRPPFVCDVPVLPSLPSPSRDVLVQQPQEVHTPSLHRNAPSLHSGANMMEWQTPRG